MKPIVIRRDSRAPGTCRSCGARIEWATVAATNTRTPFNPPIVLEPALMMDDSIGVARVDMVNTTSHFATCPQADRWRQSRR